MYQSAYYEEPLLNELQENTTNTFSPLKDLPTYLQRKQPINIPNLDETQIVRHFLHLSQMNYGIESGIYPLGSCTMKYNPKLSDKIADWDHFSLTHPFQDETTIQGNLQLLYELEQQLCTITGMDHFTLQPAAGAVNTTISASRSPGLQARGPRCRNKPALRSRHRHSQNRHFLD